MLDLMHPFDDYYGRGNPSRDTAYYDRMPHQSHGYNPHQRAPRSTTDPYSHAPSSNAPSSTAVPKITTSSASDEYIIAASPPSGHDLRGAQAVLVGPFELQLTGVVQPKDAAYEYLTSGRTGVYAAPGRRGLLGVAPPRSLLRGDAPTQGWIALESEHGWVHTGDVQLLSRPAQPRHFARTVELPADALTRHATSHTLAAGGLQVCIPRQAARVAKRPASKAAPPKAPPTKSAPKTVVAEEAVPGDGGRLTAAAIRKPAAPKAAPPKAATSRRAAPKAAAATTEASAEVSHKRAAAAATSKPPAAGIGRHLPMSEAGPVLMEVEAAATNIQLPQETIQHWRASASGGFVPCHDD